MSDKEITSASAEDLLDFAKTRKKQGLPPVELWNPPLSGEMDMRIARDGAWIHEGGRISRPGLVQLFASILKKENDNYYLVTPVEKWKITVEDAPFVAVDFTVEGSSDHQILRFETNVGDHVVASKELPIRVDRDDDTGEPSPYVLVRANLEALIDRKSFYRLVNIGTHHDGWFGVWSSGTFFPMIPSDELPEG